MKKKECFRLAHTSLKSVEVPPWPPPPETAFLGGVMLFALFSFLIVQIFSEKVQNVANILKIRWKKGSDHIYDLRIKNSIFIKKKCWFFDEIFDLSNLKKNQFWKNDGTHFSWGTFITLSIKWNNYLFFLDDLSQKKF